MRNWLMGIMTLLWVVVIVSLVVALFDGSLLAFVRSGLFISPTVTGAWLIAAFLVVIGALPAIITSLASSES